jgi:hypothetical protein
VRRPVREAMPRSARGRSIVRSVRGAARPSSSARAIAACWAISPTPKRSASASASASVASARAASGSCRRRRSQRRDLAIAADQRLLGQGGEQAQQPNAARRRAGTDRPHAIVAGPRSRRDRGGRQLSPPQARRANRPRHALEREVARVAERDLLARGDQLADQLLDQHLAAVRRRAQAARDHDGHPMQVVAVDDRLAGRDPDARRDAEAVVRAVQPNDRRLDRRSGAQRAQRAVEARHRTVAQQLDHATSGGHHRLAHVSDMRPAHDVHTVIAEASKQRRRVDEVAEHHDRDTSHETHPSGPS